VVAIGPDRRVLHPALRFHCLEKRPGHHDPWAMVLEVVSHMKERSCLRTEPAPEEGHLKKELLFIEE